MFGDRATGAYLTKHNWTRITRHVMVAGSSSPDDPDLEGYWAARRRRGQPALDGGTLALLGRQQAGTAPPRAAEHLVHVSCAVRHHNRQRRSTKLQPA